MSATAELVPFACLVCGALASPGDRFCGACGALLPDRPAARPAADKLELEWLFVYQGRIGRLEFLLTGVVLSLFLIMALGLVAALSDNILGVLLGLLLTGATAFALACASIKRLHDIDTTGWLAIIAVIPMIGWVFVPILALIGSTRGQNAYGAPDGGSVRPRRV